MNRATLRKNWWPAVCQRVSLVTGLLGGYGSSTPSWNLELDKITRKLVGHLEAAAKPMARRLASARHAAPPRPQGRDRTSCVGCPGCWGSRLDTVEVDRCQENPDNDPERKARKPCQSGCHRPSLSDRREYYMNTSFLSIPKRLPRLCRGASVRFYRSGVIQ